MMRVTIVLPDGLGRYCGGEASHLVDGATAAEAVEDLVRRFPDVKIRLLNAGGELHPYFMAIHNGAAVPHEELPQLQLSDGDRLELLSMASGG